jgi:capsular exopolysaccharide synthesis family protein
MLRRRKWVIAAIVAAVLAAAMLFSFRQTPVYEAKASVLVESSPTSGSTPSAPNMATEKLVAGSSAVAKTVGELLKSDETPSELLRSLSVNVPVETEVLDFTYADEHPAVAQQRAQAFADAYLQFRKRKLEQDTQASRRSLQAQIRTLNAALEALNKRAGASSSPGQQSLLQAQSTSLNSQIFILQERLAELSLSEDQSPGRIVEDATVPERPSRPNHTLHAVLGVVVGLILGIGVVLTREYVGDRIQGPKDLEYQVGAPVLSAIPAIRARRAPAAARLVTLHRPNSSAAEAFRHLRANFVVAAASHNAKTILITSAREQEGKTFTTANLGVVLAKAGHQVIVLSADFRRSQLEQFFSIKSSHGFVDALGNDTEPPSVVPASWMWSVGANLTVAPAGTPPENPTELLGSTTMAVFIKELRDQADFVLIDAPPLLTVADAATVAPACDAVMIVADADSSTRAQVMETREQLARIQAPLLGAVLVNMPANGLKPYRRG